MSVKLREKLFEKIYKISLFLQKCCIMNVSNALSLGVTERISKNSPENTTARLKRI